MTDAEVILAVVNACQAIALAWIASRQQQVKHDLQRVNGHIDGKLEDLKVLVEARTGAP